MKQKQTVEADVTLKPALKQDFVSSILLFRVNSSASYLAGEKRPGELLGRRVRRITSPGMDHGPQRDLMGISVSHGLRSMQTRCVMLCTCDCE